MSYAENTTNTEQFHIETNTIILHQMWFFLWPMILRIHLGRVSLSGCQSQSSEPFNFSKHPFDGLSLINLLVPFVAAFMFFQSSLIRTNGWVHGAGHVTEWEEPQPHR